MLDIDSNTIEESTTERKIYAGGYILCNFCHDRGDDVIAIPPQVLYARYLYRVWSMYTINFYIYFQGYERPLHSSPAILVATKQGYFE